MDAYEKEQRLQEHIVIQDLRQTQLSDTPMMQQIAEEVAAEQAEEQKAARDAAAEARFNSPEAKEKRAEKEHLDLAKALFGVQ